MGCCCSCCCCYKSLNKEFKAVTDVLTRELRLKEEIFSENDTSSLPDPVKKYFKCCKLIGTPKMSSILINHNNVKFMMQKGKKPIDIFYTQHNFVKEPARFALINTRTCGFSFDGLDSYVNGKGSMKGVLCHCFTLFNQVGIEMDKACLVTVLAECLAIPSIALQPYIKWESIDNLHAKGKISFGGISGEGIFTFNDKGEMESFDTNDRGQTESDGTIKHIPWTAVVSDYKDINGIRLPTSFKAIWHYPDQDSVYFDSINAGIICKY